MTSASLWLTATMAGTQASDENEPVWQSELIVSDAIGRLMEFWGFKRNMGRVWTLMYLSGRPLTAQDLRDRLRLSAGAVSMTLTELGRWGVVRRVWVQGERKDFFGAETNLWKMITRVLGERERAEIDAAIESFEDALAFLEIRRKEGEPAERKRASAQIDRVRALLDLAKMGRQLLQALVSTAKVDASPLTAALLGVRK
jgi:DNA-binding transcriptional regulator GbsR (MarR family)